MSNLNKRFLYGENLSTHLFLSMAKEYYRLLLAANEDSYLLKNIDELKIEATIITKDGKSGDVERLVVPRFILLDEAINE